MSMSVETPSPRSPMAQNTEGAAPRALLAVGVFRENKGRSWRRAAGIAAMRFVVGNVQNALDLKFGSVTTAELYATWARKNGADVLTDELSEGATLHWIGPRRKDRVLLFLHGGCYIIPARVDYFNMLESLRKEYKGAVGMALLNYSLAPEHPFPKQLRQTIAAIQHLLDLGVPLASQLLHPHPSLPRLRLPSHASTETDSAFPEPFGGMLLISPWLEFNTDAPSFARNNTRDVLPHRSWQIQKTGAVIAEEVKDTTVFVLPGGVHEDFIEAFASGEGERGDDYKLVVSWLSASLKL
ncbi:hypothetical protein BGY98DRAFT_932890 [Russula aff. rugulosa BPL654]|nr:hypothetical protein BGY98DRAFT_932890 [Russula aff. rugulosa BPL654]